MHPTSRLCECTPRFTCRRCLNRCVERNIADSVPDRRPSTPRASIRRNGSYWVVRLPVARYYDKQFIDAYPQHLDGAYPFVNWKHAVQFVSNISRIYQVVAT